MDGEVVNACAAIPTRYKGYHFRSRLEARWAVFFDAIGWSWDYEVEGFDLGRRGGGGYLPDFWVRLPEGGRWLVEIKPRAEPDSDHACDGAPIWKVLSAAARISKSTKETWYGYVFCGPPGAGGVEVLTRYGERAAADAAKSARFEHGERGAT